MRKPQLASIQKLPVKIANSIAEVWRDETIKLLEDNPFRLLQFNVPWPRCCEVAKEFDTQHLLRNIKQV